MKALTVLEPWASLIATGQKRYETRSWVTRHRGALAIHAGVNPVIAKQVWSDPRYIHLRRGMLLAGMGHWRDLPFGCVVAVCRIVDVLDSGTALQRSWGSDERFFGDFSHGRFAWELEVLERLQEPIPARGYQGVWTWERAA